MLQDWTKNPKAQKINIYKKSVGSQECIPCPKRKNPVGSLKHVLQRNKFTASFLQIKKKFIVLSLLYFKDIFYILEF